MQNFDELAEKYISAVENQKQTEGTATDSFTRGDMETCYVVGAQEMSELQEGHEGTFGQAIGSLKHGKMVARRGWNGKGMYLWLMQPAMVKAEWCKEPHLKALAEKNGGTIEALGSIRMLTADGKILTGWLASQTDILSEDWVLVNPE